MIPRSAEHIILTLLKQFPVVAVVGPRQAGKSTLAGRILTSHPGAVHLDLELPSDEARLLDPQAYFTANSDRLICIDEVQRLPDLYPVIRALVDRDRRPGRFLILGSASPSLRRQSGESLAGRVAYEDLTPFQLAEVGRDSLRSHWLRGGFPLSFLAPGESESFVWRQRFIRTFLEADIPAMGIDVSRTTIERLWSMLAAGTATMLNKAKLAEPVGVSPQTVTRYLDILESASMVRVLRPLVANVRKRLARTPKVYIRDTGLLHALLRIDSWDALFGHIAIGPSWESYVVEQLCAGLPDWTPSFYRTSGGAEIDLVLERAERRVAVEIKASSNPRLGRGFYEAVEDIGATGRFVAAPLDRPDSYPVGRDTVVATPDRIIEQLGEVTQ